MRIVTCTVLAVLAVGLSCARPVSQNAIGPAAQGKNDMFSSHMFYGKGRIGTINDHLYVIVESDSNELIMQPAWGGEVRWKGRNATTEEVVICYEGKVWPSLVLPNGFDLSKAVVVSFEGKKVRFFDFDSSLGGYFERNINPKY